jgi:hypothetical protein
VEKSAERYEAAFDVSGPSIVHKRVVRELIARSEIQRITRAL